MTTITTMTKTIIDQYTNTPAALLRLSNNKTLYIKFLKAFLSSNDFTALEEALSMKNYAEAINILHTIKGLTGNLYLDPLFELSAALMYQMQYGEYNESVINDYRHTLALTIQAVTQLIDNLNSEP